MDNTIRTVSAPLHLHPRRHKDSKMTMQWITLGDPELKLCVAPDPAESLFLAKAVK